MGYFQALQGCWTFVGIEIESVANIMGELDPGPGGSHRVSVHGWPPSGCVRMTIQFGVSACLVW